jgi:5,5'-dehydrodivanillate O-demethylase oxygenase subunit
MAMVSGTESGTSTQPEWYDLIHTGPGTLSGRFMRMFWHPVYVADDLPDGRAKPIRIMSEDLTLYRGEGGEPHVVGFRCAHRGTQMSTGWVEGDNLRCFYHGWVYGPDGQCLEQPAEPEPFCNRIRIKRYPTQEYLGLIFVYMGEGDPPEMLRVPDMEDESQGVREVRTYSWPCNFFNSLENDPFHGLWVHRDAYETAGRAQRGLPTVTCEETEYGYQTHTTRAGGRTVTSHRFMPNSGYGRRTSTSPEAGDGVGGFENAWRSALTWRVPVDDDHFVSFGVNMTHLSPEDAVRYRELTRQVEERRTALGLVPAEELGEAVLRGEFRIEDVQDRYLDSSRLFNLQDYVSQVGQGKAPDYQNEHLGNSDTTVVFARNLWRRELRAMAEGRPMKQWKYPTELSVGTTHGW